MRSVNRPVRALLFCFVALGFAVSNAGNMAVIPSKDGFCGHFISSDEYCNEWALVEESSIHIVSMGSEDSGDTRLYRVDKHGKYQYVAEIVPALQDPSRPGELFLGVQQHITGIVVTHRTKGITFRVTYRHTVDDSDDEPEPGLKKRAVPLLLFTGKATQPDAQIQGVDWVDATIEELQSKSSG
jgi:hypothetical protein